MALLRLLVFCALAACCVARSPPQTPLASFPLPRSCNDTEVRAVAGFALQSLNQDRKDGYKLSLSRVHDVWEHFQEDMGSVFYLTLDVLETDCHVLSKKAQKDCNPRVLHESVYGQCKALFHINKPRRVLYLLAYNCTLRPVSQRKIHFMCPDCPGPVDLSDPRVLEAATESLAKFNSESPSKQYSLVKVTRATSQWVAGPFYFVDYLIKESSCTKSQASCSLQSSDSAPVGLCHGSLIQGPLEKSVSVTCEFFEPQAQVPGGENPAVTQESKKQPSADDDEAPQKNKAPVSSPSVTAPKGSVQHLPDLDAEKPEASKGKSPGEAAEEKSPEDAFPVQLDLTTDPQGEKLDVSFLYLGPEEKKLVVLPFPGKESRSTECPGPAGETNPLVLPP
ncbi:fetuin-B [Peromyscus leucopus]|uniref:fetuin-B n=1 Tax=Peromyscus leucopus TaxID=10041 RepID=UPI0010A1C4D0|nr:fetuin-B [Peromyscus leucopus]XP_037065725.1 fetuin-B [Peromyscus leucopus]XP_037065726.1 fetuin-B [Peromyscus leucopus]